MKDQLKTNLYCFTFGHNYFRLSKISPGKPELVCKSCNEHFTYSKNDCIIPATSK